MREVNGEVADDRLFFEGPEIKIGRGSTTASDLFSYLYGITGNDTFKVQRNLSCTPRL